MALDKQRKRKARRTPALEHVFERSDAILEAALEDRELYPDGTALVATDIEGVGFAITESAREGRHILLVYPDGYEVLLTPSKLGTPESAEAKEAA